MSNVYYHPEQFGLKVVGEAQDDAAAWSFDIFAVWRDEAGNLYWADDQGCSCPSPFEDFNSLDDLTKGTVAEAHAALDAWDCKDSEYSSTHESAVELHGKLADLPSTSN